jgi:hypothetical protein
MSSQERSAGAALCITLAIFSMITAVILSAVALTATSHVSDEPLDEFKSPMELFEDPDCDVEAFSPPDQRFLDCYSKHEATMQEDAARWGNEVAARQADIQAKGNLAIIFGLLGVTLAVCAVAAQRGSRTVPPTAAPTAIDPTPSEAHPPASGEAHPPAQPPLQP